MKYWITAFLLFCGGFSFAQTMPDFELIKLEKVADYKQAEPFAMQTAVYLLSSPVEKSNADNRQKSVEFLYKWISGTPDHSFALEEMISKVGKENKDIVGVYIAATVRSSLADKTIKDASVIKLKAINLLLDYCENKNNHIKMNKLVKKMSEARQNGTLEQML